MIQSKKDIKPDEQLSVKSSGLLCTWVRAFDGNFNISCVKKTKQRVNGQFKSFTGASQWDFTYCPYCGKEIKLST